MASAGIIVRQPAVAGLFYPADPDECRSLARSYVTAAGGPSEIESATDAPRAAATAAVAAHAPRYRGGIVPHAGWICSGAIAGQTIGTIAASLARGGHKLPDVVVVFGAIHTPLPAVGAVLSTHDAWHEPAADSPVATEAKARLLEAGRADGSFAVDDRFHRREHAVEVELPLIQVAWPGVSILPVEVPAIDVAADIGRETARQLNAAGREAIYLASSDLTHYGPSYRFAPAGVGLQGLAWAKDNDRRLLDLVAGMRVDEIVPEVHERLNACGAGAIAAMLAACRECGATRATVLRHANSFETLADTHPQPPIDAVGYAAVVVS
jgi:MEMO1 family protein